MPCEDERASVELLEMWHEINREDKFDALDAVFHSFDAFGINCPNFRNPIMHVTPTRGQMWVATANLVQFLNELEKGNVTDECKLILAELLEKWRDFEVLEELGFKISETIFIAERLLEQCLHRVEAGIEPE